MALIVATSKEHKVIQNCFRVLGFFPFRFNSENYFWLKLYQRALYLFILPAIFFLILFNSNANAEKSYINRLAKECILCLGFVALWVNLLEADVTRRDQATIFSKLEEMRFTTAWTTSTSMKLYRYIAFLVACNIFNSILAMGNDFQPLNMMSRIINFWIQLRCIQIYFFNASINGKLEMMQPVLQDQRRIFDLKPDKTYGEVEKIKRSLLKIREMSFYLNNCIGWSLLFILSHWLVVFTCHFYWLFLIVKGGGSESTILGSLSAISPKLGFLFLISNEISKTNECIDTIKQYLYKMSRENFLDEDTNWLIRETLIQTHDEFYLSAYGFLRLNFSMLSSMVATIGSYLIILIQFQEAES